MCMEKKMTYYTQREWDRVVGIGKVPEKYQYPRLAPVEGIEPSASGLESEMLPLHHTDKKSP